MCNSSLKNHIKNTIFGVVFAVLGIFGFLANPLISTSVYADPVPEESSEQSQDTNQQSSQPANASTEAISDNSTSDNSTSGDSTSDPDNKSTCYDQIGAIGWLVCPSTGALGKAIDAIYSQLEKLLILEPVSTNPSTPVFQVWQVMRDFSNITFVIFLLIVIYSQITGLGINNYGIKKALPKLIIAAILVNMSYIICALAVDLSNIIGFSLRGIFTNIQQTAIDAGGLANASNISYTELTEAAIVGGTVAGVAIAVNSIWPLLAALVGAILSVIVGLITLGLRQALVSILIMISPLALICYLLPNTDKWFKKWKDIFTSMLIFYPMFSVLYGASALAGWTLIASAISSGSTFMLIVGMAIQVLPLLLSISLLKMSGTVLGAASAKFDSLMNKPRDGFRNLAAQRQELHRLRHINNSYLPSASLQRYLDKRNRARELDIENETAIRRGNAEIWAQRRILGSQNYDPAYRDEYKDKSNKKYELRTNASTRSAKKALNIGMETKYVKDDTQDILGNYGDFHYKTKQDNKLSSTAAQNFKEINRSEYTLINNDEADFNWLAGEYFKAAAAGEDSYQYKHFIKSSGGSLGAKGSTGVLGQLVAKSSANEARHRHDFAILGNKFTIDKTAFRNLVVGYYVNDDGIATKKPTKPGEKPEKAYWEETTADGKTIKHYEQFPGEFLHYHPEALTPYDVKDENGLYYQMKDFDGNPVTKIYRDDTPVIKEIFQNFDTPIQDPIDGLYGMLAGIERGSLANIGLPDVGLKNYRTTIGRSIQGAKFKEKAAFASPMFTTSVTKGYIKDFSHIFIERLQNITKTIRSGNFNSQDAFELQQLSALFDPHLFDNNEAGLKYLFPENALRNYQDVNGKGLVGSILDEHNNIIGSVPESQATYEQLLNTIKAKLLFPSAQAVAFMMSGATTPNVADNLKSGAAENWGVLASNIKDWTSEESKSHGLPNPFVRKTSVQNTAHDLKSRINEASGFKSGKSAYSTNDPSSSNTILNNHSAPATPEDEYYNQLKERALSIHQKLDSLKYSYLYDADGFREESLVLIGEDPEFQDVYYEYTNFIDDNPHATTDELHDALIESLYRFE